MSEVNTTTCRFYEQKYPEIDDVVMVNVKEIADMGAYVKLLEYDEIEGMILLSELSRRRIRSIQKLIKVGRNEIAVVLRVDKDKGYIDLSKRRVSREDALKCEEKYNKSKSVHSILRHVAEKHQVPLEQLYQTYAWPLARKYGHAYDGFKLVITNPEQVFEGIDTGDKTIFDDLVAQISRKLTPDPTEIRANIEVTCFAYDGIDAVKAALKEGQQAATDKIPITIKFVASPLFILQSLSLDKQGAIKVLNDAIDRIRDSITKAGGSLVVKMEPKAVTVTDDDELKKLMERSELETKQVDGDDYDSEADEGEDFE